MPSGRIFDQDGVLYSESAGTLTEDAAQRTVTVVPNKRVRALQKGDLIYGQVTDMFESICLVEFTPLPLEDGTIPTQNDKAAILRVNELMSAYVDSLRDFIRTGDYLKAVVTDVSNTGIIISLKRNDLGIIKAHFRRPRRDLFIENRGNPQQGGDRPRRDDRGGRFGSRGSDRGGRGGDRGGDRRGGSSRGREGGRPFGDRPRREDRGAGREGGDRFNRAPRRERTLSDVGGLSAGPRQ